jgi:hypothetical protein
MRMPAEIVFGGGETLKVDQSLSASDLTKRLAQAHPNDKAHFLGDFLNVQVEDGGQVWVNPVQVAYVREV